MSLICILGRQPALGLAELESRYSVEALSPVQSGIVQLETDHIPNFDQFGGTVKAASLLTRLDYTDWNRIQRFIQKTLPQNLDDIPEGKITLGISTYGIPSKPDQINAAALSLKKVIKQAGRSARIVPNNEVELNTAQVIHNKLTSPNGIELLLIKDGMGTIIAQTIWVQDIDAYRRRDQERPMRDARIGMLPPKLAQIIINLANPSDEDTVLDPFCGTGVVLQESILMGLQAFGSDIEPRMAEYTNKNLEWLNSSSRLGMSPRPDLSGLRDASLKTTIQPPASVADATSHKWSQNFDTIACETYLGRALSSMPDQETLQKIIRDCDTIHAKFLRNVARQTEAGFRMCIAVPAWYTRNGFKHMPVLDHLEELGYNQVSFKHVSSEDLIYHREGQIVARELIILIRK